MRMQQTLVFRASGSGQKFRLDPAKRLILLTIGLLGLILLGTVLGAGLPQPDVMVSQPLPAAIEREKLVPAPSRVVDTSGGQVGLVTGTQSEGNSKSGEDLWSGLVGLSGKNQSETNSANTK